MVRSRGCTRCGENEETPRKKEKRSRSFEREEKRTKERKTIERATEYEAKASLHRERNTEENSSYRGLVFTFHSASGIVTIVIVMGASALRAAYEDIKRWRADVRINSSTTVVLQSDGSEDKVDWFV